MLRAGQLITMATGPTDGLPSLPDTAAAELLTVPQLSLVVGEEMCTDKLAPFSRVTPVAPPHLSTPPASIRQVHPADSLSKVHVHQPVDSFPTRRSSDLVAVPVPASLLLVTVIV